MPPVLVLQHVPHEGPALLGEALRARGASLDVRRLDQGADVPARLLAGQALLVMGGPMGVGDRHDPRLPFLEREIALLAAALRDGNPVLGICLGSQLLAAAAGAEVHANPLREVGFAAVQRLAAGDPLFAGQDADPLVLHWHGDTFALPAGARLLASTPLCRHQAFRLGRALGLQFHPEVDAATIRSWVAADADYVRGANGPQGCADLLADLDRLYPAFRRDGDRMVASLAAHLLG